MTNFLHQFEDNDLPIGQHTIQLIVVSQSYFISLSVLVLAITH